MFIQRDKPIVIWGWADAGDKVLVKFGDEQAEATAAGDVVSSGDLLFELYSPTLVNAQQEYLTAFRSFKRAGARNRELLKTARHSLFYFEVSESEAMKLGESLGIQAANNCLARIS